MRTARVSTGILSLLAVAGGIFAFVGTVGAQQTEFATSTECTFNPAAQRSPREMWHELSRQAELIAPSDLVQKNNATGGRRRAVQPPKVNWQAKNFIDDEIFAKMAKDGIKWTVPASDEEFLRRIYLDLTGQIPTAEKVKSFLADTSASKRDKLIDDLLSSEEFIERWTVWLGEMTQNVTVAANTVLFVNGRNAYYTFMRDSIRNGKPYDQIVREMVGSNGANWTQGQVNYWVRNIQNNGPIQDTYDNLSADSAEKFLGLPLNCLSCHNGIGHLEQVNTSLVPRTRSDFWKNAAFFAATQTTTRRDPVNNQSEYTLVENAVGEYRLNTSTGNKTPRAAPAGQPNTVTPAFFLSGETMKSGEARREAYARILTANPQFARATVNYVWKEVFGIGIVEPADSFDLNRQNPATLAPGMTLQPTHPQLITRLADHFVGNGYSLRALLKTIVSSNAYQLSSRYAPGGWNELWTPYYARHYPRRMLAESVLDAICRSTSRPQTYQIGGLPNITRAMQIPDPLEPNGRNNIGAFLNGFGRGDRDTTARTSEGSIVQALAMLNDPIVTTRVRANQNSTVDQVLRATKDPGTITDELYVATLSRRPSSQERAAAIAFLGNGDLTRNAEDLQYALLNRLEFLYK